MWYNCRAGDPPTSLGTRGGGSSHTPLFGPVRAGDTEGRVPDTRQSYSLVVLVSTPGLTFTITTFPPNIIKHIHVLPFALQARVLVGFLVVLGNDYGRPTLASSLHHTTFTATHRLVIIHNGCSKLCVLYKCLYSHK